MNKIAIEPMTPTPYPPVPSTPETNIPAPHPSPHRNFVRAVIIFLLLLVAGIMFLWLKSGGSFTPDTPVTEHDFLEAHAIWSITPYPAITLQNNTFTVSLTTMSGEQLQNAKLTIALVMPSMNHGEYSFELIETSPGIYIGAGVPLMPGLWKATLTLENGDHPLQAITRTLKAVHKSVSP